jgi:hypothetical protein
MAMIVSRRAHLMSGAGHRIMKAAAGAAHRRVIRAGAQAAERAFSDLVERTGAKVDGPIGVVGPA